MFHILAPFMIFVNFILHVFSKGRIGFASSPFLPEEIADVRERLLEFFMMEVVESGGSCRVHGATYS